MVFNSSSILVNKKKIWKANPVIRNKKPIENSTILPEQIVKSNIFNKTIKWV